MIAQAHIEAILLMHAMPCHALHTIAYLPQYLLHHSATTSGYIRFAIQPIFVCELYKWAGHITDEKIDYNRNPF